VGRNRPARLLSREPGGLFGVSGANGAKSCKSEVRARTLERKDMAAGDVAVLAEGALEAAGTRDRGSTVPERLIHSRKSAERARGSAPGLETPLLTGHGDPACGRVGDAVPASRQAGARREPPAPASPPAARAAQGASSRRAGGRQRRGERGDTAAKPSPAPNNPLPCGLPRAPQQPQGSCCAQSPPDPNCASPPRGRGPARSGVPGQATCAVPGGQHLVLPVALFSHQLPQRLGHQPLVAAGKQKSEAPGLPPRALPTRTLPPSTSAQRHGGPRERETESQNSRG